MSSPIARLRRRYVFDFKRLAAQISIFVFMRPMACDTEDIRSGSESRTTRELPELLTYLVRLDAVFVAGVAAA
ncbi:hypothetical protein [Burkholderia sp. BCC1977]|uniref:hypothetical protein n=1 Tax=Burkholderia sp. BCC1977 TaxID=2817440 RepID=UPI002ABDCCA8|nr:hypothetical protein [Burkholderia sp. BCC1977]